MGIFSSIKDAIFGKSAEAQETAAPAAPTAAPVEAAPAAPVAISSVDVAAQLQAMADASGKPSNWRVSIVDLMALLGLDHSLANRKELAVELGYTGELDGSAEMNIWLHKQVMRELAANGGTVPQELLD